MGKISVSELSEGMVLEEDVKSGSQILLAKGVALSEKHINVFKSWGINSVEIVGIDEKDLSNKKIAKISSKARKQLDQELKEKFSHVEMQFYPAEVLYKACLIERSKKL